MARATLLIIQGVDEGTRFELNESPAGIGRGVRNDIRISDTEISRQHARIEVIEGAFQLTDLNSSNGTFVNGKPIRNCSLKTGDRLQMGRTVFVFQDHAQSTRTSSSLVDLVSGTGELDQSQILAQIEADDDRLVGDRTIAQGPDDVRLMASLQTLYRVAEEVVRPSLSTEQMLDRILRLSIAAIGADRGCVLLTNESTGGVDPVAYRHQKSSGPAVRMPVSRSIVAYVMQHGQAVRTSDARTDSRFEHGESILRAGIREAMCVPMQGHSSLLGMIYVDTTVESRGDSQLTGARGRFSDDQLRLLLAVGRQAALAVESSHYQSAMMKAERLAAMGQTIAMLSHHIKNILQGVRGGSYLIDMGLQEDKNDLVRKGWRIVERNQNKIYHLVMDMLTFSKERKPTLEYAQLNDTVMDVCELMQARSVESEVRFDFELADDIPESMFDPEAIHRAVLNITTNAFDAVESEENGRVLVQTSFDHESDMLIVAVTDNGPGIPPDQLGQIFNIFESSKGARGTGLGLAVSLKILREHGGEIDVESEPGAGCRFVLAWPRLEEDSNGADRATMAE